MTSYTDILNSEIDTDSPVTQPLWTKTRDNPIAISEGASGSPVIRAGWHPFDQVEMDDGNDGLIYDFSVDGSQAWAASSTFTDGYEYRFYAEEIENGGAGTFFEVQVFLETDAAWQSAAKYGSFAASDRVTSETFIPVPNMAKTSHMVSGFAVGGSGAALSGAGFAGGVYDATSQKVSAARVGFTGANLTAGRVYLYRRRMDV